MQLFLIVIFGSIGVGLRYLLTTSSLSLWPNIYFPTLVSNVLGCFLFGLFYIVFIKQNSSFGMPLTIGLCGGLTTLSSFCFEIIKLVENKNFLLGSCYPLVILTTCCLLVYFGIVVGKYITG